MDDSVTALRMLAIAANHSLGNSKHDGISHAQSAAALAVLDMLSALLHCWCLC